MSSVSEVTGGNSINSINDAYCNSDITTVKVGYKLRARRLSMCNLASSASKQEFIATLNNNRSMLSTRLLYLLSQSFGLHISYSIYDWFDILDSM